MSQTNFSQTYYSTTSVSIPDNAANVTITVAGASGGAGGADGGSAGGNGGNGRVATFRYITDFVARNPTLVVGSMGSGGASNVKGGGAGAGGASSLAAGARGGNTGGGRGPSGGGGGGGGASGLLNAAGTPLIVAGGGGGGGGGSWERTGLAGSDAGGWSSSIGTVSAGNSNNVEYPWDGGGGGGGGGGAPGGNGGPFGNDQSNSASGGGGGGSAYNSSVLQYVTGDSYHSGNGYVTLSYTLYTPQISSFSASPNPQTSGVTGTPSSSTTLNWTTVDANTASIDQGIGTVNVSGSYGVNTGLQSVTGSNSPATKTYTLTICAGSVCATSSTTVSVYNDNLPNSFAIPTTTTTGVSLNNLEPNTQYQIYVGPITGIDMITAVVCNTAGLDASTNQSNWSGTIYISNGNGFYLRFISQPFNTDPSGTYNSKTFYFTVGSFVTTSFTAITRPPIVNEVFDFGDNTGAFAYPDIDQISNTPTAYVNSPTTLTVDNVEIPVEIKVDKPSAEIRIKSSGGSTFGSWQTPRSI